MYYTHKAYLNSRGGPTVLTLTHDAKRCLADSKAKSGLLHIISSYGTIGVKLMENDAKLHQAYLDSVQKMFAQSDESKTSRRSGTGANKFHLMAAQCGLEITVPFEAGRLNSSPFHEILAFDFEPKAGRREFVITIVGE
ncbi:MAG: YjbQ family protein [bacterium]|nr:YjbQ family protein [bacterium]MBU1917028.1 YjbQ family protein [bacterium]